MLRHNTVLGFDMSCRHPGDKMSKLVGFLINGESFTVIRKCCSLWPAFLSFICSSTYFHFYVCFSEEINVQLRHISTIPV